MGLKNKLSILVFVGNYLPGYKAGGILRSLANAVDYLCDDFDFWIVTRDRDLGDKIPYPNVHIDKWQRIGNSMVFYLSTSSRTVNYIGKIISNTQHDVLYLNSYFDVLTIKALYFRLTNMGRYGPVIVAPRGEFGWASLKQKYLKKFIFIQLSKVVGLYNNVTWHASSEVEASEIQKIMNVNHRHIHIAPDLPMKIDSSDIPKFNNMEVQSCRGLKILFLSRISREKNLDYALRILMKVRANVTYDIYGPAENEIYWNECLNIIHQLPPNVTVNYHGKVNSKDVLDTFSRYDLFLFPTGGENYGHVIAESLIAGTPVLISTKTPWRNLASDELGWDIDLGDDNSFVEIIDRLAKLNNIERFEMRFKIRRNVIKRIIDPTVINANRKLYNKYKYNPCSQ